MVNEKFITLDDLSLYKDLEEGKINTLLANKANIADLSIISENIAPLYDSAATYDEGDLVMYNNRLYKCTTAITTAEAWDVNHWATTNIVEAVLGLLNQAQ